MNGLDHIVPDCLSRSMKGSRDYQVGSDEEFLENHIFRITPVNKEWLERINREQDIDRAIGSAKQQLLSNKVICEGRFKIYQ